MSSQVHDPKDEFQQLSNELQLMIEEKQAWIMQGTREMMTELTMGNNSPPESSRAESSAAVRGGGERLNPLLCDNFLLMLLPLEAEPRGDTTAVKRNDSVRMPRVMWE